MTLNEFTKFCIYLFIFSFSINMFSQKTRVIDNKGTISTINNNRVFTTSDGSEPAVAIESDVWFDILNNSIKILDVYTLPGNIVSQTWRSLGTGSTITGTTGSIFFAGTDGKPTENNSQFFWNNTVPSGSTTGYHLILGSRTSAIQNSRRTKLNVFGSATTTRGYIAKRFGSEVSYRFYNDRDTGIRRPNIDDNLSLVTGGTEALRIDDSQNVGIGTASPTSTFDVNGSVSKSITELTTGTGNFNLTEVHHTIIVKTSRNIILPLANSCNGRIYVIKNVSGGTISCTTYKDEFDTNTSDINNNTLVWLQSDGVNWQLLINTLQKDKGTLILNRESSIQLTPSPNPTNTFYNLPVNTTHIMDNNPILFQVISNGKIRILQDGFYIISGEISTTNMPSGDTKYILALFINNVRRAYLSRGFASLPSTDYWGTTGVIMYKLNANDVVDIRYVLNANSLNSNFLNIGITKLY